MTTAEKQRTDALVTANVHRLACARYKRRIAAATCVDGALAVAGLLDEPIAPGRTRTIDGPVGALRVGQLLLSIRTVGDMKATSLLRHAQIVSADRRVRELTLRQRRALASELRLLPPVLHVTSEAA